MKTTLKRESLLIPKNSKKFTIGGGKYRSVCRTSFAYPPPFIFDPREQWLRHCSPAASKIKPLFPEIPLSETHTPKPNYLYGRWTLELFFLSSLHISFFPLRWFFTHFEKKKVFYRVCTRFLWLWECHENACPAGTRICSSILTPVPCVNFALYS